MAIKLIQQIRRAIYRLNDPFTEVSFFLMLGVLVVGLIAFGIDRYPEMAKVFFTYLMVILGTLMALYGPVRIGWELWRRWNLPPEMDNRYRWRMFKDDDDD